MTKVHVPAAPAGNERKVLVCVMAVLMVLGMIMVYSSSAFGHSADPTYKLRRQALWAVIATVAMILAWQTDYRAYARHRRLILGAVIALLLCVYVPGIGRQVNGAYRWLRIGPLNVQPSELAKVGLILYVASTIEEMGERAASFRRGFLPLAGAVGAVSLLVLMEPDFGTGVFLAFLGVTLMFVGGVRILHIAVFGTAVLLPVLAGLALRFEHVRARLSVFLNAEADPLGRGYQIKQSVIALGSGGLFGLGLGESRQKLMFLPERDTDFIFAILGEEMGFVGAASVIVLFMLLLCCGMKIAARCGDRYSYLVAAGMTVAIALQAVLNVAVVSASVPPKGIALPFFSAGGSSLVATMLAVGILLNVAKRDAAGSIAAAQMEEDGDV